MANERENEKKKSGFWTWVKRIVGGASVAAVAVVGVSFLLPALGASVATAAAVSSVTSAVAVGAATVAAGAGVAGVGKVVWDFGKKTVNFFKNLSKTADIHAP